MIPPEKEREIDNEIAKFLQHITEESKKRLLDSVDVGALKNFDRVGRHFLSMSALQPDTSRLAARLSSSTLKKIHSPKKTALAQSPS